MGTYPVRKISEEVEAIIGRRRVAKIEVTVARDGEKAVECFYAVKPLWHGAVIIFDRNSIALVAESQYVIDAVAVLLSYVEEKLGKIAGVTVKEA